MTPEDIATINRALESLVTAMRRVGQEVANVLVRIADYFVKVSYEDVKRAAIEQHDIPESDIREVLFLPPRVKLWNHRVILIDVDRWREKMDQGLVSDEKSD